MSKQKPTLKITIATNVQKNRISFRENNGPYDSCLISDLPAPLLHLLYALDEGKRLEILFGEVIDDVKVMLGEVVDE